MYSRYISIAYKYLSLHGRYASTIPRLNCWNQPFMIPNNSCSICLTSAALKSSGAPILLRTTEQHKGPIGKLLKKLGWYLQSKSKLKRSGYFLYESVADGVNYRKLFQEFNLDDTLFSWFLITELHVWMLLVRVMAEGEEGRYVRNTIVEAMWEDVRVRSKKLGDVNLTVLQSQLKDLSEEFQAAIVGYDEGLLTDDKVLAGALWRRFFQQKCSNPEEIECLVQYIRQQVKFLDGLPREQLLFKPYIQWPVFQRIK